MRHKNRVCCALFALCFLQAACGISGELGRLAGLAGLRLDIEHSSYLNNTTNQDASFLSEGVQYATCITLSDYERVLGSYELGFNVTGRITGDLAVDRRAVSLQNLLARFARPGLFGAEFGNIYSNFSPYTLGRSLEGLNYW